jgi:hypothetical protein
VYSDPVCKLVLKYKLKRERESERSEERERKKGKRETLYLIWENVIDDSGTGKLPVSAR